ncbi:hypothetical protein G3576_15755 [Roseomonas stagni]|uniref:Uncharacterized protein n=1 Tax=Falsiroseomonas algicola TaxID=2716930 RepID=A0A6M1LN77_9PROT|nr:hypothetical protein [Falsiroseomonas algicola]NGM21479.1 hypothetical protein [Falsiroseomonas algicola]
MIRALRVVCFIGFTFIGLLMLGASFWRALFGTLALAALRFTPTPANVVYGIGAVVFGLGILQWSTGVVIPR